ncbi:DUF4347 domain-containing protein [Flavobacterium sp. GA093]|uniref:DUF4347 domain-containing protein n=1 Tax=Flavobacterium hydrocarbonoxydans TaxID=2683249 RepID=A0A6I4NLY3_9FLAO|nr:DUF4347 domain-containing protein [Flavobacterium hydrocarbonoxydans]MWB95396.1 DUF4347 domain-containing protein [Flavobacterium hydrocarbonoxydans]
MKKLLNLIPYFFFFLFSFSSIATPLSDHFYIEKDIKETGKIISNLTKKVNTQTFQLFSHGKSGELYIDNHWMKKEEIVLFLKSKLSKNVNHLNIYGCEFGKDEKGLTAVRYLEKELGISVAASTNITGKNGDWVLELGKPIHVLAIKNYKADLQYGPAEDYDKDGVVNSNDLDDDNDGILDTNECVGTSTFELTADNLVNRNTTTETTFPKTYTNVYGISGLNIKITPSGNFTTNTAEPNTPQITNDGFDFGSFKTHVNRASGDGVASSWNIEFVGSVFPTTVVMSTPGNLFALPTGSYELIDVQLTRMSTGTFAVVANPATCGLTGDNSLTLSSSLNAASGFPTVTGVSKGTCGFTSTHTDNIGFTKIVLKYSIPQTVGATSTTLQAASFSITVCNSDIDNDGIPSAFDLDSDGDGCSDALEGGANFTNANLVNSSIAGGNSGTGYTGSSTIPIIQNLGNTVGSTGVPTIAGTGQTVGDSRNGLVNSCICYKPGVTSGTGGLPSVTGISNFLGLPGNPKYWLTNMPKNGALVMGSKDKGFVITRIANPETVITGANAVKGMLVFDTAANCLKMYDGTQWFCLTQKCIDN